MIHDQVILKTLEVVCGKSLKGLRYVSWRSSHKFCKHSLMGDCSQSTDDQNADRSAAEKVQAQEVSIQNKDYTGSWTPSHVC